MKKPEIYKLKKRLGKLSAYSNTYIEGVQSIYPGITVYLVHIHNALSYLTEENQKTISTILNNPDLKDEYFEAVSEEEMWKGLHIVWADPK